MKDRLSLITLTLAACCVLPLAACGDDADPQEADVAVDVTADTADARDTSDVAETSAETLDDTAEDDSSADVSEAGADADAPDGETEVEEDVLVPPSTCSSTRREDCYYLADERFDFATTRVDGLTYTDVLGGTRNVNIAIYRPTDAPTPAPIVILSHGGTQGQVNPLRSMEYWAPHFVEAGYLVVGIAHEEREFDNYVALCRALEVQQGLPCGVKLAWDRQHDLDRVLDWLEESAGTEEYGGAYDLERIAYVGHAAGASAVLMALGATRNFSCAQPFGVVSAVQDCQVEGLVSLPEPRVDVGIALSPDGPGTEGFMDQSYGNVTRPLMMATGAADGATGEPSSRLGVWPLLPPGGKFKLYLNDPGAQHAFFEGAFNVCRDTTPVERCDGMRFGLLGATLAFLDAHLKNDAHAKVWLGSADVTVGSEGAIVYERK